MTIALIFNESYYLNTNPEVAELVANGDFASGLEHFEAVGIDEGLRFSPFIDLDYYKRVANPDLSDLTNREALNHLLEVGIDEGLVFSPFIDLAFYQQANPDLADLSNFEALLHLQDIGLEQGRQFSPFVDLEEYRSFNPELSTQSLTDTFAHLATFFAPEEEGRIRFPLAVTGVSLPDEVDIVTPEMLTGSAEATITYSKSDDRVILELDIDGLPYQLDFTRSEDVSTPYNQFPVAIEDAEWQVWLIGNQFNIETTFWYDGQTGQLIANEFDLLNRPLAEDGSVDVNNDGVADISVQVPTIQAIGTPIFEGTPDGQAQVSFKFDYDRLLDERGTAGFYQAFLPYNLNQPEEVGVYYTDGGLPVSEAMTWDDVLSTIRTTGLGLALSLEPDPKPDFLDSRDNTMLAWKNLYPTIIPENVVFEAASGTFRFAEASDLVTHVNPPTPARLAAIEAETELIFGGLGDDLLDAVDLKDDFDGNRDTVFAGAGDDLVDASQANAPSFPSTLGHNRIFGGTGDDELLAGQSDRLFGGDGDDLLDSSLGRGNNRLYGQAGEDIFFAGEGDRFFGGDGDDTFFITDGGDNLLYGGDGSDTFWITTGEILASPNAIADLEVGVDAIGFAGLGASSIDDLVFEQVGDDVTIGFSGSDLVVLPNIQVDDLQANGTFVFA